LIQLVEHNTNIQNDIDLIANIDAVSTILQVVCESTGMGFAAVARVTDKQWVACAVRDNINFGMIAGGELELETTICHEVRGNRTHVVFDHATEDSVFSSHHTPLKYGIESYVSMPIILKDGRFFGTLCAIDPRPAKVNNEPIIGMFRLFADLISFHINALEELSLSERKLSEERETAELRDQFIAILGHDLRNPVGAISNAAQLLLRIPDQDRVNKLAHIIKDSSFRIKNLIENILDFARGQVGAGLDLNINDGSDLESKLDQVISELMLINPGVIINKDFHSCGPFPCDSLRIAQLFSNILSNAITHGNASLPIRVTAAIVDGNFILSVANSGDRIPVEKLDALFKPFVRGPNSSAKQGLGLGLYIAQTIAQAHGGSITASSSEEETVFTLTLFGPEQEVL
jgi:signal transduction histidine kinase